MNETWRIAAGHPPEPWLLALLLLAAGLAAVEALAAARRPGVSLGTGRRLALLALRLLGVAALAALAVELTLYVERAAPASARVLALVDTSASMALADADAPGAPTTRRIDRLRAFWAESADARAAWRARGLDLEVRAFDRAPRTLPAVDAEALELAADGPASDLARALVEEGPARSQSADLRPLAAVLVLSDGLVAPDLAAEAPLRAAAAAAQAPITTVAAGAPAIRDLALQGVQAGEFAFVENVSEIDAEVVAHGLEGSLARVELRRDGAPIAAQPLTLAADGVPARVRFEVAPDRAGHFVYELVAEPLPGEATLANNRRAFVVKVLRDKVRVLHVAGRPDWDVRALRTLLGRDPNVELLSYYILRGVDDSDREDPSAELSLIAFPTDELFSEELGSFDLVILHNFDARSHQVGRYLNNIARYVEDGGALVMIGGDLGLATGDYQGSKIARLLPIDLASAERLDTALFRPRLTDAGRRHPITAWLVDPALDGGAALPALDSHNPARLAPGLQALAGASLLDHPGGGPLLAVAEPGRGRVVALTTGATWRLGFAQGLPRIGGARPYDLLWLGIIRWLLRDESVDRLALEIARPTVAPGEPIELRATALGPTYAPEPEVRLRYEVRPLAPAADAPDHPRHPTSSAGPNPSATVARPRPDRSAPSAPTDPDAPPADASPTGPDRPPLRTGTLVTNALGRASQTLDPLPLGAYEVTAERLSAEPDAAAATTTSGPRARRVLLVDAPSRELADIDADPGTHRLDDLARRTGGLALSAARGDRLPHDLPLSAAAAAATLRVESRREVPLWHRWPALLLLVIALGGEWLLRRRSGLS